MTSLRMKPRGMKAFSIKCYLIRRFAGVLLTLGVMPAMAFEVLVPAYFYPGGKSLTYWDQLVAAAPKVPLVVILNPASGPGVAVDAKYTLAVNRVRAAGGKVLGYVPTGYGSRAVNRVTQDILNYQSFYPIDGIFLDEMANDGSTTLAYYASLYQYIKALNPAWRVIGNPGMDSLQVYLSYPSVDAMVLFEDQARVYQRSSAPAWVGGVPPAAIGHLVTNVPDLATAVSFLTLARQRNAGLVYFTNDKLSGNPWDTLPPWWAQWVTRVCQANGRTGC